jgi:hypothetical protein
MQAAMDEMTNQIGAHVETEGGCGRVERTELEAKRFVKSDVLLKNLMQHGVKMGLFSSGTAF